MCTCDGITEVKHGRWPWLVCVCECVRTYLSAWFCLHLISSHLKNPIRETQAEIKRETDRQKKRTWASVQNSLPSSLPPALRLMREKAGHVLFLSSSFLSSAPLLSSSHQLTSSYLPAADALWLRACVIMCWDLRLWSLCCSYRLRHQSPWMTFHPNVRLIPSPGPSLAPAQSPGPL